MNRAELTRMPQWTRIALSIIFLAAMSLAFTAAVFAQQESAQQNELEQEEAQPDEAPQEATQPGETQQDEAQPDEAGARRGGRRGFGQGRGQRGGGQGRRGGVQRAPVTEPPAVPAPHVETTGAVPSDAIVIFDGTSTDKFVGPNGQPINWPVQDGAIYVATGADGQRGLWTTYHFGDAQIHAEVFVPESNRSGENASNSGLYLHGLFELQILDTYDSNVPDTRIMGSVYNMNGPLVNASRPAGQWQTYDIVYRTPKRDEAGEPIEEGSITAFLNGVLVQDHFRFLRHVSTYAPLYNQGTDYSRAIRDSVLRTGAGPLQLQHHGSSVGFRNIWIRPLDDRAFVFDANAPAPDEATDAEESTDDDEDAVSPDEDDDAGADSDGEEDSGSADDDDAVEEVGNDDPR